MPTKKHFSVHANIQRMLRFVTVHTSRSNANRMVRLSQGIVLNFGYFSVATENRFFGRDRKTGFWLQDSLSYLMNSGAKIGREALQKNFNQPKVTQIQLFGSSQQAIFCALPPLIVFEIWSWPVKCLMHLNLYLAKLRLWPGTQRSLCG